MASHNLLGAMAEKFLPLVVDRPAATNHQAAGSVCEVVRRKDRVIPLAAQDSGSERRAAESNASLK